MLSPVASLSGIGVRVGDTPILRGLDLELGGGDSVGLMGANGSGKTTLLRVLATLLPPSAGTGSVLGAGLDSDDRYDVRDRIALVGHTASLYEDLTLQENLEFAARVLGLEAASVHTALDTVGLATGRHRRAAQSSQGMRRRAEFARILMTAPDLLLLDEAHTGLDPQAVSLVDHLVGDVTGRGGAAVVVSHEPSRIASTVTRVVTLADGRVTK